MDFPHPSAVTLLLCSLRVVFVFQATAVFEGLDNGEILCAACPNAKVFITGGISCVSHRMFSKCK